MRSLVTSVFLYVFESWTLIAELQRRIRAKEMRYYSKILRISHEDLHEDLAIVKRRKMQWHGHVSRSSSLAKTFLQGSVNGGRRQGQTEEELGSHRGMDRPGVR